MQAPAIIVTGAAGGIGAADALPRGADGRQLILFDRRKVRFPVGVIGWTLHRDVAGPGGTLVAFANIQPEGATVRTPANVAGWKPGAQIEEKVGAIWTPMVYIKVDETLPIDGTVRPLMQDSSDRAVVTMVRVTGDTATGENLAHVATHAGYEGLTRLILRAHQSYRGGRIRDGSGQYDSPFLLSLYCIRDRYRRRSGSEGRAIRPSYIMAAQPFRRGRA